MAGLWGQMSEHERARELLSPYLDGRVNEAERVWVERHLESCADCARDLATLRVTVAAVREMPRVHAPRSFALPRSMAARQPRATRWAYPLLRGATALATFLFAAVLGMDLFARRAPLPTAAPQMVMPAALPPTVVAMEHDVTAATSGSAPAPTQRVETLAATSAPQVAAPAAPMPTAVVRQALATPASESAPQALGAASAPVTATPAAKAAQPVPPAEPPTEQPLMDAGLGGGGQSPGAPPPAPANEATITGARGFAAATTQPTLAPTAIAQATPGPTLVVRAPEPQPPAAPLREGAYSTPPPAVNTLRILEGTLAVLALALGVATWVARRRSR